MTKRKSKGAYMISAVAEMYEIHPQTLRLYEREGLLKPSRTEGNTRLYTDEDLQRLEFILSLARDLGVNISGIAIILQMRERMEEMQHQIQDFVQYRFSTRCWLGLRLRPILRRGRSCRCGGWCRRWIHPAEGHFEVAAE